MIEPGYYIFLFYDVCGYTSMRVYNNDKILIRDLGKQFSDQFMDVTTYFRKTKIDTLTLVLNMVDDLGISVIDFTGDLFEKNRFYSYDDLIKDGFMEVVLNEI